MSTPAMIPAVPTADGAVTAKHNQPDPITAIRARVDQLVANANAWMAQVPVITTEQEAISCEDFLKQLRDEYSAIDLERKAQKKPHDDAADAVQATFKPILAILETAGTAITPLRSNWLIELERKQDEERLATAKRAADALKAAADAKARAAATVEAAVTVDMIPVQSSAMTAIGYDPEKGYLFIRFANALRRYGSEEMPVQKYIYDQMMAPGVSLGAFYARAIKGVYPSEVIAQSTVQSQVDAEQAQKAATAATAEASRASRQTATVRGDHTGRATGLRTTWSAQIDDWDAVFAHYKGQPEVKEVIQALANADAKKLKHDLTIPGITVRSVRA